MKKWLNAFSSLLLVLVLSVLTAVPALAASSVTFVGGAENFVFLPGSEYTDTDLFSGFKNVMPGDTLTQEIAIGNEYAGFDAVKIYLRAELHDGEKNPLSPSVADQETVATMEEFLSRLTMTVWKDGKQIYQASPDELDGLEKNVLLGSFAKGESAKLTVELQVPSELDDRFANRVGEVDWVFTAEQVKNSEPESSGSESPGPSASEASSSSSSDSSQPGPDTSDPTDSLPWIVLMAAGVGLILYIMLSGRKKRRENR